MSHDVVLTRAARSLRAMTETTRSSADPLDIAVIGGDGIGPEVTDQAAAVLQAALRAEGRPEARLTPYPLGAEHWLETGEALTDEVLETGRHGELVFTSLTKQALPIIRYRTHDLTRLLPGTTHPGHRRMGRITGRSDDMIILRGVNLFPSQIEELALKIPALSPHFTLEITRPNRMDQMTIHIERREDATVEEAQEAGRALQHEIKTKIGSSAAIDIAEPGTLERSSGKLRRVYDRRDK